MRTYRHNLLSLSELIEFHENARDTHYKWIKYLTEYPEYDQQDLVGDIAHHKEMINGYNQTITALNRFKIPNG